jgi:hypothetical protein
VRRDTVWALSIKPDRVLTQSHLTDGVCVTFILNRPTGLDLGQRAAAMDDKACSHRRQEESSWGKFPFAYAIPCNEWISITSIEDCGI